MPETESIQKYFPLIRATLSLMVASTLDALVEKLSSKGANQAAFIEAMLEELRAVP